VTNPSRWVRVWRVRARVWYWVQISVSLSVPTIPTPAYLPGISVPVPITIYILSSTPRFRSASLTIHHTSLFSPFSPFLCLWLSLVLLKVTILFFSFRSRFSLPITSLSPRHSLLSHSHRPSSLFALPEFAFLAFSRIICSTGVAAIPHTWLCERASYKAPVARRVCFCLLALREDAAHHHGGI
jgi:hypothetical protein